MPDSGNRCCNRRLGDRLGTTSSVGRLVGVIVVGAIGETAAGGETLYNGIILPSRWPPEIRRFSSEPMAVPYLQSLPSVIPIDVGRQLFVDDFLIEQTTLTRTFHKPEPYEKNPVLWPDKPWEHKSANTHGGMKDPPVAMPFSDGVWYDPADRRFKMWYVAGYGDSCTCYAQSEDGIRWTKPELDVVAGTNIVETGTRDSATVWLDLEEKDPQRRYKLMRREMRGGKHWIHFSPDGIHWTKPITCTGNAQDRSTFFRNPFRGVWVFSLRSGGYFPAIESAAAPFGQPKEHEFYVRLARLRRYREGKDLIATAQSWPSTKGFEDHGGAVPDVVPTMWVWADYLDRRRADCNNTPPELYNLDACAYESVMLGLFSIWRGRSKDYPRRDKINEVCVGFSRDGFHWHRPDREAFLGVSEDRNAWNYCNVQSAGGGCLVVGDRLYFYMSGRNTRDLNLCKGDALKRAYCSTGLAFLRRDGFASMDAGEAGGMLTTRPLVFRGKHLFVNVDAPQGELRVEVLDESGQSVKPFTREACRPVSCDKTLARVSWEGAEELSGLSGRPVRFRFHLRRGKLYAFWVSPDASGASHGYVAAGGPGFTGPTDTVGQPAGGSAAQR
ncbi:MAG: hypothetical protein JXQ73_11710 [Phycisphaerae bacterium]|nr:hypothetical protein [Phycisphaerae bacterium]